MTLPDPHFWDLFDGIPFCDADALAARLAQRPAEGIADFERSLHALVRSSNTSDLLAACVVVHSGGFSDDSWLHFRLWLIGQGRETFTGVLRDPDAVAGIPDIIAFAAGRRPYPHYPELLTVAERAYDLMVARVPAELAELPDLRELFSR
ncbi:DUF4240 domain-containing protein [Dactylosporangium sp. NPDC000244]|uniref:DUF4240 domain-containing protein n=1 Tax=Dactylosporangium sp. NPDC000244 TaxID=3154365 RepID=UPI003329B422